MRFMRFIFRSVAIYVKTLDNTRPITAAIAVNVETDLLVSGNTKANNSSCFLLLNA